MRSRDSVLLEFDQLLNMLFGNAKTSSLWFWKQRGVEAAIQSFCRDANSVVSKSDLHLYATKNWLSKRGFDSRPDIRQSLSEMLNTQIPLRM